jgi:hypothetical protein
VTVSREGTAWADLRTAPSDESDRQAQLLVGDRVRVREQHGAWSLVETEGEAPTGGWVRTAALTAGSAAVRDAYAGRFLFVVVASPAARLDGGVLLPFGAVLAMPPKPCGEGVCLLLPDGRIARVPLGQAALVGSVPLARALDLAKGLRHGRYQTGGNTIEAMDAPGLVHLVFRTANVVVARDLSGLLRAGREAPPDALLPGDVVFFRQFDPSRPHPVLLLDAGQTFLDASPGGGVNIGFMEQMRNRETVAVRRYRGLGE